MNKVLVYLKEDALENSGGPLGYNYILKEKMKDMGVNNIHYLKVPINYLSKYDHMGRGIKGTWYGDSLKMIKDFYKHYMMLYGGGKKSLVDLSEYDIIHFHSTRDLFSAKESLEDYKGKVVLTSHCPIAPYKEELSKLTEWERNHMMWFYKKLEKIDEYAFKRADYLIFPCEEAEEPYFHTWEKYPEIKQEKKHCYKYLLTGTQRRYPKISREEYRYKNGIPQEAKVLSFVGRHNHIKGYDFLKEIGSKLLSEIPNLYILIGGVEDPLKGLNNSRWKEIGWTNDPHSLIAASDLFILPNKETYFDLVLLEVLSLGVIVLASDTGGNRYFKNQVGVSFYADEEDAINKIVELLSLSYEEKEIRQKDNIALFDKYFNDAVFAQNYVNLMNSL